jgi:hypothetical protein
VVSRIGEYEIHPLADAWPLTEGEAFADLVADLKEFGQHNKIWRWRGRADEPIVDGRNRLRACVALGIKPRFDYFGGDNVLAFIRSQNDHRRHLSWEARVIVAARLATLMPGRPAKTGGAAGLTQSAAAAATDVKERTLRRGAALLETGAPELVAAFERQELGLEAACELAKLEPAEQLAKLEQLAAAKAEQSRRRGAAKNENARAEQKAEQIANEKTSPRVHLFRLVETALTAAGASVMLDSKGAHVGFRGDVFLLQLVQQPKRGERAA